MSQFALFVTDRLFPGRLSVKNCEEYLSHPGDRIQLVYSDALIFMTYANMPLTYQRTARCALDQFFMILFVVKVCCSCLVPQGSTEKLILAVK